MPHPSHHPTRPRHGEAHVPRDDQLDEVQQLLLALTGGTGLVPPPRARAASEGGPDGNRHSWHPRGSRALAPLPSSERWAVVGCGGQGLLPCAHHLDLLLLIAGLQPPPGDHPSPRSPEPTRFKGLCPIPPATSLRPQPGQPVRCISLATGLI